MFRDRRRKHRHFKVTVYYHNEETFARTYIEEARAHAFADRQKRSPIVKNAIVREVNKP